MNNYLKYLKQYGEYHANAQLLLMDAQKMNFLIITLMGWLLHVSSAQFQIPSKVCLRLEELLNLMEKFGCLSICEVINQ